MIGSNGAAVAAVGSREGDEELEGNDRRRLSVVDDSRDFMIRDISRENRRRKEGDR